jgi:hypothetical protein
VNRKLEALAEQMKRRNNASNQGRLSWASRRANAQQASTNPPAEPAGPAAPEPAARDK